MKIKLLFIFTLIILTANSIKAEEINWLDDLKDAQKIAQKDGKPILLDFTAKWCAPCKTMDANFWTRPNVIELSKQFVCVKIDYDTSYNVRKKYNVRGVPFIVLTDSWGLGLNFHRGFRESIADQIIEKLEFAPKDFNEIIQAANVLDKNKNELSSLIKIAEFYQQKNLYYQSNEYYLRILDLKKQTSERETVMLNLGFNYLRLTIPIEAERIFKQFQEEFPDSQQYDKAIYGEFYALVQKGRVNAAKELLEEMKLSFPKSEMIATANQILTDANLSNK